MIGGLDKEEIGGGELEWGNWRRIGGFDQDEGLEEEEDGRG
jgi:hypothetical protein